ncbi:MAG: adenylyl-sulfate kinase [Deltaproteobacteria bacterium]|nr:adenylyl-sulfate kinase [Deltaproteobacteria bacterium]
MLPVSAYTAPRGFTVWLTGLSGAGKSTLAATLREHLIQGGLPNLTIFDGDEARALLWRDLGFTREDREANIRRLGDLCTLLTGQGLVTIVAAISPYRRCRQDLRRRLQAFVEVYVACPLEVCERRDVKGLYARARAGEIKLFTGLDDPYEPPEAPEVTVCTDRETVEEGVAKIIAALLDRGLLRIAPAADMDQGSGSALPTQVAGRLAGPCA